PFGHGRIEYLSAMLISVLVLYAGLTSLVESAKKIISPQEPDYSAAALVILVSGVLVKLLLGRYVKSVGERVQSDSLVNSGTDALLDAVISASTVAAAVIYLLFHISLEAWLAAVISIVILRSGVEMLRETLSRILGERVDADMARGIRETVCSFPPVSGAYDLVLHNYGPEAFQGSIHIEVPDTCSANELDELIRRITAEVYRKHHVYLTAVGVYSLNTRDPQVAEMREKIKETALGQPYILQIHGFYVDEEARTVRFDMIVSFDAPDRRAACRAAVDKVQALYPAYTFQVAMDTDFAET
ncbi:MAG: cation transporter, partial [Oscillibacter sp.]|nr:cation transporter [Oscillibacter sp.]